MIHEEGAGPCWLAGAFERFEALAHVAEREKRDEEDRIAGYRNRDRDRKGVGR